MEFFYSHTQQRGGLDRTLHLQRLGNFTSFFPACLLDMMQDKIEYYILS